VKKIVSSVFDFRSRRTRNTHTKTGLHLYIYIYMVVEKSRRRWHTTRRGANITHTRDRKRARKSSRETRDGAVRSGRADGKAIAAASRRESLFASASRSCPPLYSVHVYIYIYILYIHCVRIHCSPYNTHCQILRPRRRTRETPPIPIRHGRFSCGARSKMEGPSPLKRVATETTPATTTTTATPTCPSLSAARTRVNFSRAFRRRFPVVR